ncbi:HAD-IA family hydrolase [Vibrio sp. SCSIO 43137]|uniref:HAD-IA family hydrolase n=1 Tax=Vibrio sp. SCSIO 43137 TaxID=3021011 RepID=UPI00230703A9|nr:HAD-IA family hydrolase [Vibrio sp. SCSIO 43137]WCE32585.1 HAD-IA family hydrolase [Vibrio sp. SCSIO 43137]
MQQLSNIQCVIFDCDGVLIDSEPLCCRALLNVFVCFKPNLTYSEIEKHFRGGKIADILTETRDRLGLNISLDELEPLYRKQTQVLFQALLQPMPGINQVLDQLDSNGVQYCVVSNSPKSKIEYYLRLTGLYEKFQGKLFSAFDANSWKPDPDLLLYAAMNMGFSTAECLYVDDSDKGIEAGLNAGIATIHFKSTLNRRSDFYPETLSISKAEQLPAILFEV